MTGEISRQQARELLAWYVNGTLPAEQRAQVESWLARDAGLRAERTFLDQAATTLRGNAARPASSSVGRFLERVATEQVDGNAGDAVVRMKYAPQKMPVGRKWAFALAAGVILAQAAVIGGLVMRDGEWGILEPLSGPTQAMRANLQVTFIETAPEIEIRALLAEAGAQIVSGPGALGVYGLHVPPEQLDQVEGRLRRASNVVASVTRAGS